MRDLVGRARRLAVPRLLLGVLGALLVLIGLGELLTDHMMWLYVVHTLSGLVALAATPWRRLVKPALVLIGALYVFLYILESADPAAAGDEPDPSSNTSLIMTGVVLVVIIVALMWPWIPLSRHLGGRRQERRPSR